jgi:DNA polymerase-3 subunit delta'
VIEPVERDEEGNEDVLDAILVERIRELIDFTQLSTHRQRAKVAVIAPALMNAAAASAVLKTLEEPPPATYLILVSHQVGRLPATIVSRCLMLAAPEPDPAVAMAWLAEQGTTQPQRLLAQAGGAPLSRSRACRPGEAAGSRAADRGLADPGRMSRWRSARGWMPTARRSARRRSPMCSTGC